MAHTLNTIDSIDLGSVEGFDITAEMVPDSTYYSEPDGEYTPEQIAAFQRGDWQYVGIIVGASRAGVLLGTDSVWGMEYGTLAPDSAFVNPLKGVGPEFANGYGPDLIDNAVADARLKLSELVNNKQQRFDQFICEKNGCGDCFHDWCLCKCHNTTAIGEV